MTFNHPEGDTCLFLKKKFRLFLNLFVYVSFIIYSE